MPDPLLSGQMFNTAYCNDGTYKIYAFEDSVFVAVTSEVPKINLEYHKTLFSEDGEVRDMCVLAVKKPPRYFFDTWYTNKCERDETYFGHYDVTINWGDGTQPEKIFITHPVLNTDFSHNYKQNGEYSITMTVKSNCDRTDGFGKRIFSKIASKSVSHKIIISNIKH